MAGGIHSPSPVLSRGDLRVSLHISREEGSTDRQGRREGRNPSYDGGRDAAITIEGEKETDMVSEATTQREEKIRKLQETQAVRDAYDIAVAGLKEAHLREPEDDRFYEIAFDRVLEHLLS